MREREEGEREMHGVGHHTMQMSRDEETEMHTCKYSQYTHKPYSISTVGGTPEWCAWQEGCQSTNL